MIRAKSIVYSHASIGTDGYIFSFLIDEVPYDIILHVSTPSRLTSEQQQLILTHLGMVYLIDLAEIVLPEKIVIHSSFTKDQITFWKYMYTNMVVEKVFAQQLSISLLDIPWEYSHTPLENISFSTPPKNHTIICVSAGKESLTAIKLLENTKENSLFFLEIENNIYRKIAYDSLRKKFSSIYSVSNEHTIWRTLFHKYDQKIFSGFDIGHLIFQTLLFADEATHVVIGNEYSAESGNATYEGLAVNHQFVKTYNVAKNVNEYIHTYITKHFSYVSPFFGMYEYKIMERFLKDDAYVDLWSSCNWATPEKNFCCNCYKCANVYILALVYKDKAFLQKYFSKDLLQIEKLTIPLMDPRYVKPLECVAERKEIWVALDEIQKLGKDTDSPTIIYFNTHIYPTIKNKLSEYKQEISSIKKKDFVISSEEF